MSANQNTISCELIHTLVTELCSCHLVVVMPMAPTLRDVETITEDISEDKIISNIRVEDDQTVYYNGQGSEVYAEYDEHSNTISMSGKDATMGNFEQTYANEYDEEGNLLSVKTTYNGDDRCASGR